MDSSDDETNLENQDDSIVEIVDSYLKTIEEISEQQKD